jgi:ribosomal protein L22
MAEEKKDQNKTAAKKPTAKKPAPKKPAAKKASGSSSRAKKPAAKPKAKESATKPSRSAATKPAAGSAAKATSKAKPAAKPKAEASTAATKTAAESKPKPKPKEPVERPVVSARARFVRVAPRKARLVADQVRGLPLDDALPLLRFSTRSAAQDIRKLIESAAANAENNHDLVADELFIKDIHVDEGPTLRRYRPRALGRATRINKRTSHIAVALTPED